jgi:inositol-1,3,4-trisphosphate 5/6-kinase/inositol-tetrakisphosphate 1-kinase
MGDKQFIVERPSIRNFTAGDYDTIFFNSNDVSKPYASSFLTKMEECDLEQPVHEADNNKLKMITSRLQQTFKLDLFGVDVIIENVTGRYAIIDINTFPGYEDVPDFFEHLLHFLQQKLNNIVNYHNRMLHN